MIRTVLAVVLTAALLGASLPAVNDGRRDHAEGVVGTELRDVEQTARELLATDDPTDSGARRIVVVRLPARSWANGDVEAVRIEEASNAGGARFTWAVGDGPRRVRHLPNLPLRTADGTPLRLASAGRHRLVLSLDGSSASSSVTVRRFKSDDGTTGAHATVAPDE